MTTLTLTKTLLNTDLSKIPASSKILYEYYVANDAAYAFANGTFFNLSEFVLSNNGKTKTYTDPSAGDYKTKGSAVITFSEAEQIQTVSASINLSKLTRINAEGTFATGLSIKVNTKLKDSNLTIEFSGKDMSFSGTDGSKWLIKSNTSYKQTFPINNNGDISVSDPKANWSISSIASYDSNGNGLIYKGDFKINLLNQEYLGTVKSCQMVIGGKTLNVSLKDLPDIPFATLIVGPGTPYTFSSVMPNLFLTGNDTLTVSSTDKPEGPIMGYAGNDKITGSNTDDFLYGGDGLGTNSGNDTLNGGAGDDNIFGEDGNDTLNGGAGNDILYGDYFTDNGNDTLNGGDGDDYLFAGGGVNKLIGGKGNDDIVACGLKDTLTGGSGQDTFYIVEQANEVIITDFKVKDDFIYVQTDIVNSSSFYKAAGAKNPIAVGQYYVYDTKSGTLYYDYDSLGDNDAVAIATLVGKPDISVDNFVAILAPG